MNGQEPNRALEKASERKTIELVPNAEREREDTSTAKEMAFTFSSGEGMRHYASERRDWNGESGTDECIERAGEITQGVNRLEQIQIIIITANGGNELSALGALFE